MFCLEVTNQSKISALFASASALRRTFTTEPSTLSERCIAGLGYSNLTPFNTPGEYTEEELAAHLEKFADLVAASPDLPHSPVDTDLDKIRQELHAGSRAVRDIYREASALNISFAAISMRPKVW